jgi:hypothetical protein
LNREAIDIEAKVTRIELPDSEELETAKHLAAQVTEQMGAWVRRWHDVVMNPATVIIEPMPAETVGVSPGSCVLKSGERVLAKFVVRYVENPIGVEIDAEWPTKEWDTAEDDPNGHEVRYQVMPDRVDWACADLGLEGSSEDVASMKRKLTAKFGMRFRYTEV